MYITQANSKASLRPIDIIKKSYDEFLNNVKTQSADGKGKTQYSKELYEYTKNFLEERKNDLSPRDKRKIFERYIEVWAKAKCALDIANTDYAERYKNNRWTKYSGSYNSRVPMMAGFNLEGIDLINADYTFLLFPSVNFANADFSYSCFAYSHFQDCDMPNIMANDVNFNQCPIRKCNLSSSNLLTVDLCEVQLWKCNLYDTQLKNTVNTRYCTYIPPATEKRDEQTSEDHFAALFLAIKAEKKAAKRNGLFTDSYSSPYRRMLSAMNDIVGHQYSFARGLKAIEKAAEEIGNQAILNAINACRETPEQFQVEPRWPRN